MTNPDDPAFDYPIYNSQNGLTKREYLAAMAMNGFISFRFETIDYKPEHIAIMAIAYADALIIALNKPKEK